MGATGTAILDFGAFPGKSDTNVDITGQAGIVSGSIVGAWIRPVATGNHSSDEHMVETLNIFAGNIVAGVGFTIYGFNINQLNEPLNIKTPEVCRSVGGIGTRIYGQWTVQWAWN